MTKIETFTGSDTSSIVRAVNAWLHETELKGGIIKNISMTETRMEFSIRSTVLVIYETW